MQSYGVKCKSIESYRLNYNITDNYTLLLTLNFDQASVLRQANEKVKSTYKI